MAKGKNFRRKYFRKRRNGTAALALKMVKQLKKSLRPELKVFDAGALDAISNTGTVTTLCIPSQGTTYINREGIVIAPKWVDFRAQIQMATAATVSFLRIIFFRGRNDSGGTYAPTDILLSASLDQPYVWLTRSSFTILSDRTYQFSDTNNQGIYLKRRYNVSKKRIHFTGNGTGLQDGGIYMLMISNEPTNLVNVDWHTRTSFTDV